MRVKMLGAPTSDGTDIRGCELAPARLRELGLAAMIGRYGPCEDMGDVIVTDNKSENFDNNRIFNYKRVIDFNRALAMKAREMAGDEDFSLFFGGDHSISAGTIAGVLDAHPDTAVVWLDAHGDLNTDETSPSKKAHGMPGAALLGAGDRRLGEAIPGGGRLANDRLFLIGQRESALDAGEIELINKKRIYLRTWQDMKAQGVAGVIEEILGTMRAKGLDRVHLSFDIDAVDAEFVPGTGTAVNGGPDALYVKIILRALAGSGMLRSMDFVELNPALDTDGSTARLSMELLEEVFSHLK